MTTDLPGLRSRRTEILLLLAVIALALALRCLFLSKESLWLDEVASWHFASGDIQRALKAEATNPPLYYLILHFWARLFGTSEAALRALSIPPGVLAVALLYLVGRKAFSAKIGLAAALYQAVSSFQVYYSQEARAFALLTCLILLSTLFLLAGASAVSRRARTLYFAGYAVATTLSLYTHFIAVFYVAAQAVYVILRKPRKHALVFSWAIAAGSALIVFLPWLRVMLSAASGQGQMRRHVLLKVPQAFFSFMFGDTLVPLDERAVQDIAGTLRNYSVVLMVAVAATAILLPLCVAALKRWRDGALLTLVMAGAPVFLAFLVSLRIPFFNQRYLIASSPFVYLIVAAGGYEAIRRLWNGQSRVAAGAGALGAALYAALVLLSLCNYYFGARFGREQWREAVALLESRSMSSDLVLLEPDYISGCYEYYQKKGLTYWAMTPSRGDQIVAQEQGPVERLRQHSRVWLVRCHYENDRLLEALRRLFRQHESFVFPKAKGIEVYGFSK